MKDEHCSIIEMRPTVAELRADLRKNELLLKAVREELGQVQRERDAVRSDINELLEENGRLLLSIQCGLTECNHLREALKQIAEAYANNEPISAQWAQEALAQKEAQS